MTAMKVTVGLIGHGVMSHVWDSDKGAVVDKFIADTVTIWLERFGEKGKDTENMHEGNFKAVALAIARKRLGAEVFPVQIDMPKWMPKKPAKKEN